MFSSSVITRTDNSKIVSMWSCFFWPTAICEHAFRRFWLCSYVKELYTVHVVPLQNSVVLQRWSKYQYTLNVCSDDVSVTY